MKCTVCGKEIKESQYIGYTLCSSECFTINFWRDVLDDDAIIVGQRCYHIGEHPQRYKGFGGALFKIVKNTGEVIETDNLWYNGDIPDEYYKGDNAKFLT